MNGSTGVIEGEHFADPARMTGDVPDSNRRSRSLRTAEWLLLLIPVVIAGAMAWQRRWVTDDAFINFRIVDNVLAGNGPVFNVGERIEAATSTLWLFVLVLFEALPTGIEIEWWSVILGIAGTVTGMLFAQRGALMLLNRPAKSFAFPFGAIVVCVLPPIWDFTTSGLENGLSFCWIGASFFFTAKFARLESLSLKWTVATGIVIGLGPLVRPDLALISATYIVAMLWTMRGNNMKRYAVALVAIGALPVAYQLFRMGYFAALAPNTAIAKEASLSRVDQGLRYLKDFVAPYWLYVPALLAAVVAASVAPWRSRTNIVVFVMPVIGGLLHGAYVVRVGGDYMHGRMLLPSLFALLTPLMAIYITRRTATIGLAVTVWAVICALTLRVPYGGWTGVAGTYSDERQYYSSVANVSHPVTMQDYAQARWVRWGQQVNDIANSGERVYLYQNLEGGEFIERAPLRTDMRANGAVLMGNIGLYGYSATPNVTIADPSGLTDPIASRLLLEERGRPGHEKGLHPLWFRARFVAPEALVTPEQQAAAGVYDCGVVAQILNATNADLTPRLFVSNVKHSFEYWDVRIPRDPFEAEQQFCRGDQ